MPHDRSGFGRPMSEDKTQRMTPDPDLMRTSTSDEPPRLPILLALLFLLITVLAIVDIVLDRPLTWWSVHVLTEATLVLASLSAASYLTWGWYKSLRDVRTLEVAVAQRRAERDAWKRKASRTLGDLSIAVDTQFHDWGLSDAERETALMLLKGLSHKRIGRLTHRSERTARQHAVAVYRKSGLAGRAELAGFFLEGMLLPDRVDPHAR